ncbi:MAG: hypothetical protein PHY54_15985 [Methylococcales bacterium]|nr:hypothetical protein [Methylococcales bacterium]
MKIDSNIFPAKLMLMSGKLNQRYTLSVNNFPALQRTALIFSVFNEASQKLSFWKFKVFYTINYGIQNIVPAGIRIALWRVKAAYFARDSQAQANLFQADLCRSRGTHKSRMPGFN